MRHDLRMADIFQKTMLRVGTYHSPDGQIDVTPNRLRHWEQQHRRLTQARQVVPMHWDHGSDIASLQPLAMSEMTAAKSRSARNSVGRMVDFKVTPDGKQAEVTFQTSNSEAASKVAANDVYVSPVIFPEWKDGAGNKYRDLITHLDLVNHPVDHSQSLAKRINHQPVIACALRMGLATKPMRLGADPMADELKDDELDEVDTELDIDADADVDATVDLDGGESMDDGEMTPSLPEAEPEITPESTGPSVGDIMLALSEHGITLPDDTTEENFMDRLRTALIATSDQTPGGDSTPPNQGPFTGDSIVADPQIATMSLYAQNAYQKDLTRRLDHLLKTGRCSPAERSQQVVKLKTVRLSLIGGKPAANDVSKWIRSRAGLPEGAIWSAKEKLRRLSVASHPKVVEGDKTPDKMSREEIDALADKILN
jgi:hypothetical protein